MNLSIIRFGIALSILLSGVASAQTRLVASASAMAAANAVEGEVKKVDLETKTLTLKHGDIKNLGMPGMTMVFQVKDSAMLGKVNAGDKVRFTAEKMESALTVTEIEAAK